MLEKIPRGFLLCILLVIITELGMPFNSQSILEEENKEKFRIICLGDSFTYEHPGVETKSWPGFLEEFLNEKSKTKKFKIYNLAYNGIGIDIMLYRLKKEYSWIKPDIVILMGQDFSGVCPYFLSNEIKANNIARKIIIEEALKKIALNINKRIYEIIFVLKINNAESEAKKENKAVNNIDAKKKIYEFIKKGNQCRDEGEFKKAENYYSQALKIDPFNICAILEFSRCYKCNANYEPALNMLKKALEIDSNNEDIFIELDDLFIRKKSPEERIVFFEQLNQTYPLNKKIYERLVRAVKVLADEFYLKEEFKKSFHYYIKLSNLENKEKRDFFSLKYRLAKKDSAQLKESNALYKFTKKLFNKINCKNNKRKKINDLEEILKICKKIKASFIVCSYPRKMPMVISEFASQHEVELINLRPNFEEKLKTEPISKYFLEDAQHCAENGSRLVAQILGEKIIDIMKKDNAND
ncbi:MAG: tetratricopeptide repeat protein [Candidatus Omnitrophota bacterium]